MKFGRLPTYDGVDFSLPPLDPVQSRYGECPVGELQLRTGCPVWAADTWLGDFLPAKTPRSARLTEYAQRLTSVELNSTFYAIPSAATFERWREQSPAGFRFCPKVPATISRGLHRGGPLRTQHRAFWDAVGALGDRLGLAFIQLPPTFSPAELSTLAAFLAEVPAGRRLAVEFRHPAWFVGGQLIAPAASLLQTTATAAVITDCAGRRDVCHHTLTAEDVLVRFAGTGNPNVDTPRLESWVDRLRLWASRGLKRAFVFTHFPLEAGGPQASRQVAKLANERLGLSLPLWQAPPPVGQLTLF